jgi:hypothetical protein
VSIPALIGPSQWCPCNGFDYDVCGDHFQTCQVKSAASQVHDWVVYRLGDILGSVGHKVKIHKITPATGKERCDLEIKDYVVRSRLIDYDRTPYVCQLSIRIQITNSNGQLTNISRSDGAPEPDGDIKTRQAAFMMTFFVFYS